jgi:hypothetical protein
MCARACMHMFVCVCVCVCVCVRVCFCMGGCLHDYVVFQWFNIDSGVYQFCVCGYALEWAVEVFRASFLHNHENKKKLKSFYFYCLVCFCVCVCVCVRARGLFDLITCVCGRVQYVADDKRGVTLDLQPLTPKCSCA